MKGDVLYLVVPCYNEDEIIRYSSQIMLNKLKELIAKNKISKNSRLCFINDGSKDKTWDIIKELHERNELISGINLSKNQGHQNALMAGLMTVKDTADAVISMDADLQDDIDAVDEMVDKYNEGCDIVYGVRSNRKKDSFFKRFTAEAFYRLMNHMGAKIIFNHADFRLMSKRALEGLSQFTEVNLFLRGIVPLIGYRTDTVEYERKERSAGESKYPLKKMLSFAFDGITSFSIKPMRLVLGMGVLSLVFALIILIYTIVSICTGKIVTGWSSLIISIWALCGLIMISIGLLGEYIGKIYLETKRRPRYIVETFLNKK